MATYKQITEYIKTTYNITVKTCWIADMKGKYNLLTHPAPNRKAIETRTNPCPPDKENYIIDAFRHFNMI